MPTYSHSLHPSVVELSGEKAAVIEQVHALIVRRAAAAAAAPRVAPSPTCVTIPLTTVSLASNFDAYINIQFDGDTNSSPCSLLVDSGNSMLIVPYWERIQPLAGYQVLGSATQPWGGPANVVKGPIEIPTDDGGVYTLSDCVFYACTDEPRTANFGAGCITPWTASAWNTPTRLGVTMQAPLSYNAAYPFAEFEYAAAADIFGPGSTPLAAAGSNLNLYRSQPSGFAFMDTIRDLEWMSLIPTSLQIGDTSTGWPGSVQRPIAMIDTGGGPVFLSDPNGYVYPATWPAAVGCPTWTSGSQSCQCVSDDLTLKLQGAAGQTSYAYSLKMTAMPPSVQGLTLVMCEVNQYMRGQQGMNIGGISALFNCICIDYSNGQVGMKPV